MRERILKIGKPESLACVVSIPDRVDTETPAVIILNSGVMHHVGACRLSVKVARKFAQQGSTAIRFDFSGIGDSASRSGSLSFEESAPLEVIEVMDHLQSTKGFNKFVLFGLCSGADIAYEAALKDPRVCGVCQIDPYSYLTWKSHIYRWMPRLFSLSHWILFLKFRAGLMKTTKLKNVEKSNVDLPSYVREFPPREKVRDGLQSLVDRDVSLFTIFTSGQDYYYKAQFEDSMKDVKFADMLDTQFYPKCRHIITEPNYQIDVVEDVVNWMGKIRTKYSDKTQQAA